MEKMRLLDGPLLELTMDRLCQQLIENHGLFAETVLVGMQPRGRFFAARIHQRLEHLTGRSIPIGQLDTTFYRDDFRRGAPLKASQTVMPFLIEKKKVVLIDDVLYTGRTIRAALTALGEYGRPNKIELLVLIDRIYSRDQPIQADYVGRSVNTIQSQRVEVAWTEQGAPHDAIWLISPGYPPPGQEAATPSPNPSI
jgi:pyrimidine operon attenuation protein / uracil phosphoribosyltransferase